MTLSRTALIREVIKRRGMVPKRNESLYFGVKVLSEKRTKEMEDYLMTDIVSYLNDFIDSKLEGDELTRPEIYTQDQFRTAITDGDLADMRDNLGVKEVVCEVESEQLIRRLSPDTPLNELFIAFVHWNINSPDDIFVYAWCVESKLGELLT